MTNTIALQGREDSPSSLKVRSSDARPGASKAWVNGDNGLNWMLKMDGWHISYNPDTSKLGIIFAGESEAETALCGDWGYYILNGDFRQEYEKLSDEGLDACIKFFLSKPELHSSWSDEPPKQKTLRTNTTLLSELARTSNQKTERINERD